MTFPARVTSVIALLAIVIGCAKPNGDSTHLSFANPEAAAVALANAVERNDMEELIRILGPGTRSLLSSGDAAVDRDERAAFLDKYRVEHQFAAGSPDHLILQVGADHFPLAFPLIRHDQHWQFDGAAGIQELAVRRVGRNELRVIDELRAFALAQHEPASGAPAPAGHGYSYRALSPAPASNDTASNNTASSDTSDATLIASPEHYGATGVMTFIVDADGVLWQRDLGESTPQLAASIETFNPDAAWTPIAPEN